MSTTEPRLTRKGQATRQRIIETAATLIYEHGAKGTSNDLVRTTAGISGSQLSHYFPDKESLVRAVISWQADAMMGRNQQPPRGPLDSVAALRAWAASWLGPDEPWRGGCSFGSLAAEVLKTEPTLRDEVAAGFDRWRADFRSGLSAMRERGELRADADLEQLASVLMAALQGGVLIAQATEDPLALRAALRCAIDQVAAHTT